MEKMIEVINHNLEAIISGIKTHKEKTEETLKKIEVEINSKSQIVATYKSQVEEAKNGISRLESDIVSLENKLKDLSVTFDSSEFSETLSVGKKEINKKIEEKKIFINEQSKRIIELNKKSDEVTRILSEFEKKKTLIESNLSTAVVAEKLYTKKINEIINFTKEHANDLENYVEDEQSEPINIKDIKDDELLKEVDDSVFKEIDDISSNAESSIEFKSIIASANEVIEKSNDVSKQSMELAQEVKSLENKISIEESTEELVNSNDEDEEVEIQELYIDDEDLEEKEFNPSMLDGYLNYEVKPVEVNVESDKEFDISNIEDNIFNETNKEESIFKQISDMVFEKKNILDDISSTNVDLTALEDAFKNEEAPFLVEIEQCGLNAEMFDEDSIKELENKFNKNNTLAFIEVMNKHDININTIYTSVNVLNNVSPQTLDEILSLFEKTNISSSTLEFIFQYLDKVNLTKLENSIKKSKDRNATEILYDCCELENDNNICNYIDLTDEELNRLKKSSSPMEYKIINNFPSVVVCNYNTIKSLNTDNLKECFTKYPHRFIFDPDKFNAILDKYDLEDLIRCINKNAAVINKL